MNRAAPDSNRSAAMQSRRRLRVTLSRLFLANGGAIALTAFALDGVLPRSAVWIIVLGFTTLSTVALVMTLRVRTRLRRFVDALASATNRVVDRPGLASPEFAHLIDDLARLGFTVAGTVDTVMTGRPDFRSWILVEPSGETWVEVGQAVHAIAVIVSGAADGRQVESAWPSGMWIDEPELLAAPASPTLELTLADHRARVAAERRAQAQLGTPPLDPDRPDGWRIRSLEDYLAWEPIQRRRTGGLRVRTDLRRRIEPSVQLWTLSTVVGVACGALLAVIR